MRRKNNPSLKILFSAAALVVAAAAGIIIYRYLPSGRHMDLDVYFSVGKDAPGAVITIGDRILEERGMILDEEGYLPLQVVQDYLNKKYYWDEETGQILYATPDEITMTQPGTQPGEKVLVVDESVYLSLSYVREHTDLDIYLGHEPDRIAIQNRFEDVEAVTVTRKGAIRYLGGIKAKILTEVYPGDTLLYHEDLDDWVRVTSWDGLTGYIQKGNVSEPGPLRMERDFSPQRTSYIKTEEPVMLIWHSSFGSESNDFLVEDTKDMMGVNVISPTWFRLDDTSGNIISYATANYITDSHRMGCQVWGMIDNFKEGVSTYETLSRYSSRQNLISALMDQALTYGLDGINVDFETLTEDSIPHFLEFLRELSIRTHAAGLVLSVDVPCPENNYTLFYDRAEQGDVVDYMIIMGYDEHTDGSMEAGSVASYPWVEQGIKDTIAEVPAERVINGVPFYTRLWRTQAGTLYSDILGIYQQAAAIPAENVQSYWDTELHQTVASWDEGGIHYQIWMEDAASIADKVALGREYGLAGTAAWRLGLETEDIWYAIMDAQGGGE